MNWPDIFFRARPAKRSEKATPVPAVSPENEPASLEEIRAEPSPAESLHPLPVSQVVLPPAPVYTDTADSAVVKDMAEADTLRQLSRSGGVRLIKRNFSTVAGLGASPTQVSHPEISPVSGGKIESVAPPAAADMQPLFEPGPPLPVAEAVGKEETPAAAVTRSGPAINLSGSREQPSKGRYPAAMTIFRRRTKIADVARIVLPPRREENQAGKPVGAPAPATPPANAVPASAESSGIVIPPAFPVAMPTRAAPASEEAPVGRPPAEVTSASAAPASPISDNPISAGMDLASTSIESTKNGDAPEEVEAEPSSSNATSESENAPPKNQVSPTTKTEPTPDDNPEESSSLPALPLADTRERREFFLSNGERIIGHVLSETSDAIYVDHSTLGVLTIPRAQIAQRPVEIILINGDRVVGDIIAETADSLFVRHASLGILTVPKNQRSTKVVEAILKDGDRILGEVLGETESFTVIRSATLGTVAVPHNRVAMLNRRAEQVEMKALPAPALTESKSAS